VARTPILFVISGPSGSGKTTLVRHILAAIPGTVFSVSYTTRVPRPGEEDGREYHFVSRAVFESMSARQEFLEHACVFDDYYGTHRRFLEQAVREGKDLILDIDVQGAAQVRARQKSVVFVFVLPPSCEDLKQRLRARGLDTAPVIERRLEFARREIERIEDYEYVVVNRDREQACGDIEAIVEVERSARGIASASAASRQRAAASRRGPQGEKISAILESFRVPTP